MKKDERIRYIVFQDGKFIETIHNKESYYLSTQEKETEDNQTNSEQTTEKSNLTENIQRKNGFMKFLNGMFLTSLVVGFSFLIISYNVSIENSLPYLNTNSPQPITDVSEDNEVLVDNETVNELSYILHTHHAINNLYEEAKTSTSKFSSGSINHAELEAELTILATQIKSLMAYNETQVSENEDLTQLYQTTSVRLEFLLELLRDVVTTKNRVLIIQVMNNGIELDEPLFNSQLSNFKSVLDRLQIPYTESENHLNFEFPKH